MPKQPSVRIAVHTRVWGCARSGWTWEVYGIVGRDRVVPLEAGTATTKAAADTAAEKSKRDNISRIAANIQRHEEESHDRDNGKD